MALEYGKGYKGRTNSVPKLKCLDGLKENQRDKRQKNN